MTTKVCIKCRIEKTIDNYFTGFNNCKECRAKYAREWRKKNPSKSKRDWGERKLLGEALYLLVTNKNLTDCFDKMTNSLLKETVKKRFQFTTTNRTFLKEHNDL